MYDSQKKRIDISSAVLQKRINLTRFGVLVRKAEKCVFKKIYISVPQIPTRKPTWKPSKRYNLRSSRAAHQEILQNTSNCSKVSETQASDKVNPATKIEFPTFTYYYIFTCESDNIDPKYTVLNISLKI